MTPVDTGNYPKTSVDLQNTAHLALSLKTPAKADALLNLPHFWKGATTRQP